MSAMNPISDEELFNFFVAEANASFSGWDFSHISGTALRMVDAPLSWSYASKILPKISRVQSLLDMGTGGGEFLSSLRPLPQHIYATEGYQPNVAIARKRLEPLGVEVVEVSDDDMLPFEDNLFELIINRHESYSPGEVLRVLKPGGQFITQQVGGGRPEDVTLNKLLGAGEGPFSYWNLEYGVSGLKDAGMHILEQKEDFFPTRFYDIGAIIYHLKAIPWHITDFSVEKYLDALFRIHLTIQAQDYIDVASHRLFIVAQKP